MSKDLKITETPIKGLYLINLVLHEDSRGWFKENYHKEKLEALGLPKFNIVQNNYSFNKDVGVTRGFHAEPWEKYISVANGKVYAAWVDLRKDGFGKTFSVVIDPAIAVYVPQGVANGYQTLVKNVTYTYLVNKHWSADSEYVSVNLFDPSIKLKWPIIKNESIVSSKDMMNPMLEFVKPMEY